MWILSILAFILGGVIAWLSTEIAETVAKKEQYSHIRFKDRLTWRIMALVWSGIIVAALSVIGAGIALDKQNRELENRLEKLELVAPLNPKSTLEEI